MKPQWCRHAGCELPAVTRFEVALQMATINTATHFGLGCGSSDRLTAGRRADVI